ncbi:MAG: radical SAM protein [Planctomycetes bacterium]|nr:radical SAM protein [Planctomycetota bacterium]
MTASCAVGEMSYTALTSRMSDRIVAGRIPVEGTLELTYRCNLACVQCYCNLPAGDEEARRKELTTPEVYRILDGIAEAGCLWLLLTGGEILLRKDFLEIYAYAKRKGFLLTLFTNGAGITARIADALASEPPFAIEITLYGASEGTYRRVTGRSGQYARVLAGIERILERRLPLALKSTIVEQNEPDLPAMREFAHARGLSFRYSAELHPRTDDPGGVVGDRLTPEAALELDRADPERWEELRKLFTVEDRSRLSNRSPSLFICYAGVSGFHINPYGRLQFCPSIEALGHDLRKVPFAEAWRRFAAFRRLQAPPVRACNECDLNVACGSCAGEAHLDSGDMTRGTEFHHRLTSLRADAFGLRLTENEKGALKIDAGT